MIILLYGPNTHPLSQKLTHIKDQYEQKYNGISQRVFNPEKEDSITDLKNFCQNDSLFESNKLGIIKNLEDWPEKEIKKLLESNTDNKSTTLIVTSTKKPKAIFSFLLKKPVTSQEFKTWTERDTHNFIKQESENKNINLTKEAVTLISQKYGNNINTTSQEIEKLSLLNKKEIDVKDIKLINNEQNFDFFFLFKKLSSNNVGEKLTAYHALKLQNEDEAKIFNMLAGSWNTKKKDAALLDKDIKSGRLEYNEAILKLIIK